MSTERMHPADLEALADLVAERLLAGGTGSGAAEPVKLVDAAEVARRFGVTRRWVYEHADRLGALRVGDGERPRLRFDVGQIADMVGARTSSKGSSISDRPQRQRSRRLRAVSDRAESPLLPIAGARDV